MTATFKFPKREDNSSEDAEKLVAWATKFHSVDAHLVWDYISLPTGESERGALNGVTIQWGLEDLEVETPEGDDVPALRATSAVHAPAGSVITHTYDGFEVAFTTVREIPDDEGLPVTVVKDVVRTVDGDTAVEVSA